METAQEDVFLVFALWDQGARGGPQAAEQEVACCPTYGDACRVRRRFRDVDIPCVIRYVGPAGGGD
jgi:hypothetical protein